MLRGRIGNWSAPHFIKQMKTESSLTPHSATIWPLWTLLFGQSIPHNFKQPPDLLDTLQTRPMPFVTLYNHLPRIHFQAKRSLPGLLVLYKISISRVVILLMQCLPSCCLLWVNGYSFILKSWSLFVRSGQIQIPGHALKSFFFIYSFFNLFENFP